MVWGGSYGEVEPDQGVSEPDRLHGVDKLLSIFEPWLYHLYKEQSLTITGFGVSGYEIKLRWMKS